MSKHAKKMKRMAEWEGRLPEIDVAHGSGEPWLYWDYGGGALRVEIPLKVDEENTPWLYVDGDAFQLVEQASGAQEMMAWTDAEIRYGAMTRVRLLETHRAAILAEEATGLTRLRQAAAVMGLFGQRERRQKTIEATARVLREDNLLASDCVKEQEGERWRTLTA